MTHIFGSVAHEYESLPDGAHAVPSASAKCSIRRRESIKLPSLLSMAHSTQSFKRMAETRAKRPSNTLAKPQAVQLSGHKPSTAEETTAPTLLDQTAVNGREW